MQSFKLVIALLLGMLSATAVTAQDTLVTLTQDTLLVEIRRQGVDKVRFYRYGEREHLLESRVAQFKAILYEDKSKNEDYYAATDTAPEADSSRLWEVITIDDNRYVGKILRQDDQYLVLETSIIGQLSLPKSNIKNMTPYKRGGQIIGGRLWPVNRQAGHYFFSPSTYNLEAGEGYYQNVGILYNQARFGLTDNLSLGLGTIPIFLFNGPSPVWIAPKLTVPVQEDKFQLGIGAVAGTILGEDGGGFSLFYGGMTMGSRDTHFSINTGYGLAGGIWMEAPVFSLSGMVRIGEKGYLITDNLFIPELGDSFPYSFLSFGARTVWPNITLDYGLLFPLVDADIVGLPWLGISVPFVN
mgnify:CR=1 FL=1